MSTIVVSSGPTTTVTLNRPEVRNALNDELIGELAAWAAGAAGDGSIRTVILRGAGPVFCAGADVQWMTRMAGYTREENLEDARRAARMIQALDSLPVPLVGRIHGAAIGGGAGLAALCDVAVAADDTMFGFTETTLGIVPAMIAPYIVRKVGVSAARAWCLSGARFTAAEARAIGLVHEVVPADQLDDAVERQVRLFDRAAPSAIAATKRLFNDIAGKRPADVLALTVDTIALQRVSAEGQEGMRAFLEKRAASWTAAAMGPGDPSATGSSKTRPRRRS